MAYSTFSKFKADYEAVQQAAIAYHKTGKSLPTVTADSAWALYQNTMKAPLGFQIFGRHIFDQADQIKLFMNNMKPNSSAQMPKFMQGITNTELDNFGKTNSLEGGSALLTGRDHWNFTVNDSWLLAGVHSYQDFHPTSPIITANIFHNNFILTITGRELYGMALAGYTEYNSGSEALGKVYTCTDRRKADGANLVDYQVELSKLKSVDEAKRFFVEKGFSVPQGNLV